jgi:enoyl-CoA hydratase/carnithine racemase
MNPRVKAAEAIAGAIDRCALAITLNIPEDDYRHVKVIRELVEALLVLEAEPGTRTVHLSSQQDAEWE